MHFELTSMTVTDWAVIRYYNIPPHLQFTVEWTYKDGFWFEPTLTTKVKQTAKQVKVVHRRSDGSLFDIQVLDEEGVTIRGKHCRGVSQYINICNYFIQKGE